jgi:hypothetical protein
MHEGAPFAGGRCRSFDDARIGHTIDNGAHILLGANHAALGFLDEIGARDQLVPAVGGIPFLDLTTSERWHVDTGGNPLRALLRTPPPGARRREVWKLLRLVRAGKTQSVADMFRDGGRFYERLIEPMCIAIMNAEPDAAPARLFARVVRRILMGGSGALVPQLAREGLADAFIEPALAHITTAGGVVQLGDRLRGVSIDGHRVVAADFASAPVRLGEDDALVLALPPAEVRRILPAAVPSLTLSRAIINAHFRTGTHSGQPVPLMGVLGGLSQWIFVRGDVTSVTVSAADKHLDDDADVLAAALWAETRTALGFDATLPLPPHRVVKERRATYLPPPGTGPGCGIVNAALAGDWTVAELPGTIEAAVTSGRRAAARLVA